MLARPEIRGLAEDLWLSVRRFLEKDAQSENSILEFHLARFLADLGRKLAHEPRLRAEINAGVVKLCRHSFKIKSGKSRNSSPIKSDLGTSISQYH